MASCQSLASNNSSFLLMCGRCDVHSSRFLMDRRLEGRRTLTNSDGLQPKSDGLQFYPYSLLWTHSRHSVHYHPRHKKPSKEAELSLLLYDRAFACAMLVFGCRLEQWTQILTARLDNIIWWAVCCLGRWCSQLQKHEAGEITWKLQPTSCQWF